MEEKQRISKQVIIIRKDLNMRKGKMVAQGSHASMKVLLDMMSSYSNESKQEERTLYIDRNSAIEDWINGKFTKVCVSVDSLDELNAVYEKAKSEGISCALITDAGLTEFNGVPTVTCCAIGPAWSTDVDPITGHLKLL
jgi:PTH2 family peptidyl-tRNA hydrolase